MKKWQEWAIVGVLILVIAAVLGGTYYFLTMEQKTNNNQQEIQSEKVDGQSELNEVNRDLNEVEDLDFKDLDAIEEDLETINLEGV
ncbi:MAG: hypothetical protein PHT36_02565 [Patescibacteria group bacterium]|jgi:Tfp pilus assembly protein PilO|nr:hypothetical protein [Patescibacteria group bacterium]